LTGEELQAQLDNWSRNIYGNSPHDGLEGRTPNQVLAELLAGRPKPTVDVRALDLLMGEAPGGDGTRVIGKKGLSIDGAYFQSPDFVGLEAQRVKVFYDPADMGEVLVYSMEGRFICIADNPERAGFDRAQAAMIARQAQDRMRSELRRDARRLIAKVKPHKIVEAYLNSQSSGQTQIVRTAVEVQWSTPALEEAAVALAAREPAVQGPPSYDREAIADMERRDDERARLVQERISATVSDEELFVLFLATERGAIDVSQDPQVANWHRNYRACRRAEMLDLERETDSHTPEELLLLAQRTLSKLRLRWSKEDDALHDRTSQKHLALARCG